MNERPVLGIGKLTASDRYWVLITAGRTIST